MVKVQKRFLLFKTKQKYYLEMWMHCILLEQNCTV